jgi:nicotinate-nucleotide adenylyltransferase
LKKKHIGLYFGSFNPVHNGHTAIAEYMYRQFGFDEIWFVVSPSNPLKKEEDLLDEHTRFELVKAAIKNKKYFLASDIEFQMEKPSYTYLTLRKIHTEYPQHTFALLLGGDSIKNIKLWKNHEEILQNYTIYIYPRGEKTDTIVGKNIIYTNPPLLNISSTMIREKIKNKEDISGLVCAEVGKMIGKGDKIFLYHAPSYLFQRESPKSQAF